MIAETSSPIASSQKITPGGAWNWWKNAAHSGKAMASVSSHAPTTRTKKKNRGSTVPTPGKPVAAEHTQRPPERQPGRDQSTESATKGPSAGTKLTRCPEEAPAWGRRGAVPL